MMDRVLRDHPESGKAHFVQADLFARQGKAAGARNELAQPGTGLIPAPMGMTVAPSGRLTDGWPSAGVKTSYDMGGQDFGVADASSWNGASLSDGPDEWN